MRRCKDDTWMEAFLNLAPMLAPAGVLAVFFIMVWHWTQQ